MAGQESRRGKEGTVALRAPYLCDELSLATTNQGRIRIEISQKIRGPTDPIDSAYKPWLVK